MKNPLKNPDSGAIKNKMTKCLSQHALRNIYKYGGWPKKSLGEVSWQPTLLHHITYEDKRQQTKDMMGPFQSQHVGIGDHQRKLSKK